MANETMMTNPAGGWVEFQVVEGEEPVRVQTSAGLEYKTSRENAARQIGSLVAQGWHRG